MSAGRAHGLLNEAALRELIGEIVAERLAALCPQYVSVAKAAEIADVSPDFIRDQIATGKLGRYRAGREWRVRRDELDHLLEDMGRSTKLAPEAPTAPEPSIEEKQRATVARLIRGDAE